MSKVSSDVMIMPQLQTSFLKFESFGRESACCLNGRQRQTYLIANILSLWEGRYHHNERLIADFVFFILSENTGSRNALESYFFKTY